jgi:hypothetical protein
VTFRVPLLFPVQVAISPLDTINTRRVDPDKPAGPLTSGYDEDLREPVALEEIDPLDQSKDIVDVTKYRPQIRIPCQVEVRKLEDVRQEFGGDAPITNMTFVMHNKDLLRLSLLATGEQPNCVRQLKTNDRIDAIEELNKPGMIVHPLKETLFVVELRSGSWGMGPTGQDLWICYTSNRPSTATGAGL